MMEPVRSAPFGEEHHLFRDQVRRFVMHEVAPHHARWEREGIVDRDLWRKAGAQGLLCPDLPEAHGGPGGDFLHGAIVIEEMAREGFSGPGFFIHSEMVAPYLVHFGTPAQQRRWLPAMASGEVVGAIAMTEPGAGSDLRGMKTTATRTGDRWLLRGQKVFISNGQLADLAVVAARTDPSDRNSVTLFLVDTHAPGFRRGRNLEKIGVHAQDTSELFFDDIALADDCVLGGAGEGFRQLMHGLARERLAIAISCQTKAEAALRWTVDYVAQREVFGVPLDSLQNTRFRLAELHTEAAVGRSFVDDALGRYMAGGLDATRAAMAKLWVTEMLGRVVDACLQMHGGWGYMQEYPIARAFVDARIERILGGSNEIMKEIIARAVTAGVRREPVTGRAGA
jgi:alkylation response protein AidB-like acyl-CoA dehydrogenase